MFRRAANRLHELFYSSNKKVSTTSRLIAITIITFTAYTVIPVIAEEASSDPVPPVVTEVAPTPEPTPTEVIQTPEPTPTENLPSPEATPSESPTEEELKPELLDPQPYFAFRSPHSISVDPRAGAVLLPKLALFGGGESGILCITGSAFFDIGQKNLANNDGVGDLQVAGDFSGNLRITGSAGAIQTIINSGNGLRVISTRNRLANSSITFSYGALTMPATDSTFCGLAPFRTRLSFRPLDLQMDNIKTRVDFNKP